MVGTKTISIHSDHFYVSKSVRHRSDRYSTFPERVPRNHCNRKGSSAGLSKWSAGDKGPRKISHIKEVLCPKTELSTRAEPADVTPPPNQSLDMVFTTPPLENMASMGSLGSDGRSMFYRTLKKYCFPSFRNTGSCPSPAFVDAIRAISEAHKRTQWKKKAGFWTMFSPEQNETELSRLRPVSCQAFSLLRPVITSWRRR